MSGLWLGCGLLHAVHPAHAVFIVLLGSSIVGIYLRRRLLRLRTGAGDLVAGPQHFVLLSVPFFVLMGDLALVSGVTARLVKAAQASSAIFTAAWPTWA